MRSRYLISRYLKKSPANFSRRTLNGNLTMRKILFLQVFIVSLSILGFSTGEEDSSISLAEQPRRSELKRSPDLVPPNCLERSGLQQNDQAFGVGLPDHRWPLEKKSITALTVSTSLKLLRITLIWTKYSDRVILMRSHLMDLSVRHA